jgi:glycosyltransferase involved in cell wall biosynthesis
MSSLMNHRQVAFEGMPDGASRLALVLWKGDVGGAEILNATLAERMRPLGVTVTIVFVINPKPLSDRLDRTGIPYRSLNLGRGRDVLRYPRLYAEAVADCGPDGALIVERGFMGAALRVGGYRGPIVAVEHGDFLPELQRPFSLRRLPRRIGLVAGARAVDAEVAVSNFMLEQMCSYAHARRSVRIYNGVDPDTYQPVALAPTDRDPVTIGFAGRLIPGKGADHLIQACAQVSRHHPVRLLIAGDGPERARLSRLARTLGGDSRIELLGVVNDVPAFWRRCDIAAVPGDTFVESFSMVTLEAMACGKAIVATRNGAIPELMVDGVTGTLVAPGDVEGLAAALAAYAEQPELRREHAAAARTRAIARFHIDTCAQSYIDLFDQLAASRCRVA